MPDRVVLDSSVIAAIFLQDDDDSKRARSMIRSYDRITLDTAIAEIGNVAWKKTVLFGVDSTEMLSGLQDGIEFITGMCDLLKSSDLVDEAYAIAVGNKIAFYDALFLAAAEKEHVPLLTLDKKLYAKSKGNGDVRLI
ncbi:MAG TPA: type II toxin-antitoxin system VapC family toxin [Methanotrichaceae archaeon]|nr:type II toxin-antitoxin system VapC family toxin [Methanotrichaceae archaeon]